MKRFKNILSKALLLSLTLAMCVSMTIGAEDVVWNEAFTENFDDKTTVPADYITSDTDSRFTAKISDDALETKYTNPVYIQPESTSGKNVSFTSDSKLIDLFKNGSYQATLQETVTDAYTYKVNADTGNNAYFVTDKGGSKTFRIGSHTVGSGRFRYNRLWLLADKSQKVFTANDNNAKIIVEYYAVDDTPENDFNMEQNFILNYHNTSGQNKSQSITLTDNDLNTWKTWEINLTDVDFTKTTTKDGSPWNISFSTPYSVELDAAPTVDTLTTRKQDPGFEIYVRSVRIVKVEDTSNLTFDNTKKTVKIPLGTGGNAGDSKVTFDLKVGGESYSRNAAYRVSLANENEDEVATLQIEDNGETHSIYSISSDSSGNEIKSDALYTGDIFDQNITVTFGLNFRNKTFTVEVTDGSDTLVSETSPVAINNLDKVAGCAFGDYLVVTHAGEVVESVMAIDNISYSFVEDEAGVQAKEDLDAIELDDVVEFEFVLPNTGSVNGAELEWATSDSSILSISEENGVYTATPICGEETQDVTLTATATKEVVSCAKNFTITVAEHADHIRLEEELEALQITSLDETLRAEVDFNVPTQGTDETVTVSWSSDDVTTSDGAIIVSNGVATVYRGEFDAVVTLTATVTVGEFPDTKTFAITIPGLEGTKAAFGPRQDTASVVDGVEYVSSSVQVSTPGIEGNLTFAAFSLDANGNIVDRKEDTQYVTEFATYNFTVSNLKTTGSTEVKYYFWDEDGISVINNEPTQVKDLVVEGKAKGVRLNWTASVDDYDAIAYYAVYRDGALIAMEEGVTTYLDKDVSIGENHTYTVVPVDKNDLRPENSNEGTAARIEMAFIDFSTGASNGITESHPGGSDVKWGKDEIDGVKAATPLINGKAVAINISSSVIPSDESELTIEIVYYNNNASVKVRSSISELASDGRWKTETKAAVDVIPDDTSKWKTALVSFDNAKLAHDSSNSNSGLVIFGDSNMETYIRSISVIQKDKYQ